MLQRNLLYLFVAVFFLFHWQFSPIWDVRYQGSVMMIMPVNSPHRSGKYERENQPPTQPSYSQEWRCLLYSKNPPTCDLARRLGTCFCIDFFDFFPVRTTNFGPFWMFKLIVESKTQALPEQRKGLRRMDDTGAWCGFFGALKWFQCTILEGVHYGDAIVFLHLSDIPNSLVGKKNSMEHPACKISRPPEIQKMESKTHQNFLIPGNTPQLQKSCTRG